MPSMASPFSIPFSSSSAQKIQTHKWRQPVVSVLELGGVKIGRDDVVRDDPTNNVPDAIFLKLGMQLHRRDQHPLGILKNAIYDYFDANYSNKFDKLDDLCPIVSTKEKVYFLRNFDDVLVPPDHVSRSYNDTYYIDSQTVLRCHTSAHQAELLRRGHTHFLVTGDVYRRDSIDSTHYPVFHQMEGVHVFFPGDWETSGMDGMSYVAEDLKKCLDGLARHLFGNVEMHWIDTYFPFTNPSFELEIYFQEKWLEVLGCGVTEQEILQKSGKTGNVAWAFGLGLERLAMVLFGIPDSWLFWSTDERFTSQFSKGQLGVKFKPFSKYPPCYKDMSFWINESFTENNLCEVVRGVAGDLVEEVQLIDNFTNNKGMTSQCYPIAYRSMERSLTDEEINELQWNVREQVQSKLKEKWLEVLGCGVTEQEILQKSGKTGNVAWAFGLGLERLAMVLFGIPDIQLFWSTDERLTSQFSKDQLGVKFKPFSKYPPCYKDMSFWINESFTENNLCEVVRGVAGDLVEEVQLIDNFTNNKGMTSQCYRISYRSMERSLTDEEINELQWNVREQVQSKLKVVLR